MPLVSGDHRPRVFPWPIPSRTLRSHPPSEMATQLGSGWGCLSVSLPSFGLSLGFSNLAWLKLGCIPPTRPSFDSFLCLRKPQLHPSRGSDQNLGSSQTPLLSHPIQSISKSCQFYLLSNSPFHHPLLLPLPYHPGYLMPSPWSPCSCLAPLFSTQQPGEFL